jgi:drug/metabolite transporter (DMT)-like permease
MFSIKNRIWVQYLVLCFGLLCIGWSAIFVKLAGVSGFASAFYRMGIGSIAIIPLWAKRKKSGLDFKAIRAAALCGLFFACDIAMWNTSILISKAAIATLLANLSPVWVGIGAIFILREKPKPIFWIGTFIAMLGVILIVGIDKIEHAKLSLGSILAICASVFYAAYLLTTQRVRNSLDTVSFTAISMFASTVVLFAICMVSGVQMIGYSTKSWLSLTGLGLISQLGGWLAINWALGYIKSTAASVSLLSQTIVTAILAVPLLGEMLSWVEAIGAIIVLSGIFLVNSRNFKKVAAVEPEYD